MRKTIVSILFMSAFFAASFMAVPLAPQSPAACDRACLTKFITTYLDALVAHKPGDLPTSDKIKFTEDSKEIKLGEGLWKTATKLSTFRQDILDVRQGVAGVHAVVEENGTKVMLAARLKIVDKKVTELETMVVHNQAEGMIFNINAVNTASPAMNITPEKSQLVSREEAIRIATLYPAGLKVGSFVTSDVPFAPETYRFENGQLMAGPGCTFIAGCDKIKTQQIPRLSGIVHRVGAVDEEQGIVWLRMDFGAGSVMGGGGRGGGAPRGGAAPAAAAESLNCWEMFKIYAGQVHAVEAFMKKMPLGTPTGWD